MKRILPGLAGFFFYFMKLTEKQKSFIHEYIIDKNATQSAIRAGYSKRTANEQGARLLAKVSIRKVIDKLIKDQEERTLMTADQIIIELKKIAFLDIRGAFTDQGMLKDLQDIPEDVAHAMAGIEVMELYDGRGNDREKIGYTKKIKLCSKVHALELLGKHLKMFTDRVELSGNEDDPLRIIYEPANKNKDNRDIPKEQGK